ncbi:rhamnogalacturonan lyase B N-terminal domain-containing protein [Methylobacterium sp. Leaf117]|uniref:rhamnogalacturonan lyase B N-terminal domain-containing protein n=1 Tax=Methylobacterium sp. Leaf117 TaxID=1736260 RepID=UPI0009EB2F63|nr:rhamnogalacturonan lyase B N-terminal domain-containing protein [Methylobacterium sp. Leaf117]
MSKARFRSSGARGLAVAAGLLLTARPLPALSAASSFGLSEDATSITVNTGAGLVFTVRSGAADGSGKGVGDIVSMRWHDVEYQDPAKGSQVNIGFPGLYEGQTTASVAATRVDADHIKVTVRAGDLIHAYMARRGVATIFMATTFTREPRLGLVRYIARLRRAVLPEGPEPSNLTGTDRLVEAHDVFGRPDGQTRSKHYSNLRLKDWRFFGARGPGVAAWMVRDDNEGGSGGPFYRSLLDQGTDTDQELTYIVNYGEAQTEPFRTGILDGYALAFTTGGTPDPLDTSWFGRMGLTGYVAPEARGTVTGAGLDGMDAAFGYTIGFANAQAQYWTEARPGAGTFAREGLLPGTYRLTVYKSERAVAARDVDVRAGTTTSLPTLRIDADPARDKAIWRIGTWDGTPSGFLNGDRVTTMHPSDIRMAPWSTPPFVVGQSQAATGFPAYQWADVNTPVRIRFTLTRPQVAAMTLRIGITAAFAGARPAVALNGWQAPPQVSTPQPRSRTLTVGTYRGNNRIYAIALPASALRVGRNELRLAIASGIRGIGFLSPGLSYDAIDLIPATPAAERTPDGTTVSGQPAGAGRSGSGQDGG